MFPIDRLSLTLHASTTLRNLSFGLPESLLGEFQDFDSNTIIC